MSNIVFGVAAKEVDACGSKGWLKRKMVAVVEVAMESQGEVEGKAQWQSAATWLQRDGGTMTSGNDEGYGRGQRCGCVAGEAMIEEKAMVASRGSGYCKGRWRG
ncbi:hypothetical protein B296_00026659 [Ensete ventricosum]|uniref:Uncharacterized protein n=1 Tax=Ensete ventricosum TaxID=4639 RepID=A0A427A330_ENSVE|nr:hypothetical protein B296_00026659 [Ensete ventricosum]